MCHAALQDAQDQCPRKSISVLTAPKCLLSRESLEGEGAQSVLLICITAQCPGKQKTHPVVWVPWKAWVPWGPHDRTVDTKALSEVTAPVVVCRSGSHHPWQWLSEKSRVMPVECTCDGIEGTLWRRTDTPSRTVSVRVIPSCQLLYS